MNFKLFLIIVCLSFGATAQSTFTLQQCIAYALKNNITLQLNQQNIANAVIQNKSVVYSKYPNANIDFGNGYSFGRSIDPTSNQFINQGYYFNTLSAASNVLLFGWFAKKYQAQQSELEVQATTEQYKQLQNDIALNIATAYLRILLSQEQLKIAMAQLQTDAEQTALMAKRVQAGQLPELNLVQLQAQLSTDSSNVLTSQIDINSALLDLKAILNMDAAAVLNIETPSISDLSVSILNYQSADIIFENAQKVKPSLQAGAFKIASAQKQIDIAKAAQYPTVNLAAQLGTNFASTVKSINGYTYKGEEFLGNIKFADSLIPVTRPAYTYETSTVPYLKQFSNNIRQTINLGVSIPIFNGYSAKLNIQRAKLALHTQELMQLQERTKLKQDVYKAYNDANASIQKYKASLSNIIANEKAVSYATKRFEIGMLNTQEYITQQNNLQRVRVQSIQAKYESLFKLKVLDFYLGNDIKL
jgi:outer membrane protein